MIKILNITLILSLINTEALGYTLDTNFVLLNNKLIDNKSSILVNSKFKLFTKKNSNRYTILSREELNEYFNILIDTKVDNYVLSKELQYCETKCKSCNFWRNFALISGTATATTLLFIILSIAFKIRVQL